MTVSKRAFQKLRCRQYIQHGLIYIKRGCMCAHLYSCVLLWSQEKFGIPKRAIVVVISRTGGYSVYVLNLPYLPKKITSIIFALSIE